MEQEKEQVLSQLPQVRNWDGVTLYQYQGFWLSWIALSGLIPFQKHFQPQQGDVVVATLPKSGTTWLKALAFSIINRSHYDTSSLFHPLLASNSHDLVPFFELRLYRNDLNPSAPLHLDPRQCHGRIFATHSPYSLLAPSIIQDSSSSPKCRIIYLCRNPLDVFISSYHYFPKALLHLHPDDKAADLDDPSELFDQAFDSFCRGILRYGPFLNHALEYWKVSRERPDRVLFLKYEDLKEEPVLHTKKMAEFLGCPFSPEEETREVIQDIVRLCSFETMKDLEVNQPGKTLTSGVATSSFFRKGEVGDWRNYLTPSMVERLRKLVQEKLHGSGLTFHFFNNV